MIAEGFELMLAGMGVVCSFLILLVAFMTLSTAFFKKYARWFPEPEVAPAPAPRKSGDAAAKIAVALAAAYRSRS